MRQVLGPYAVTISSLDVFGDAYDEPEIHRLVSQLPRNACIKLVSLAMTLFFNGRLVDAKGDVDLGLQHSLMQLLFPNALWRTLSALLQQTSPQRILVTDHQLLYCLSLLLRFGQREPSSQASESTTSEDLRERFSIVLLAVNDLLYPGAEEGSDNRDLEESLIRTQVFGLHQDTLFLVGRYYELFFKLPYSERSQQYPNRLDLEAAFQDSNGVPMFDYFVASVAASARFMRWRADSAPPYYERWWLDPDAYFSKTKWDLDAARRSLDLITSTPSHLKKGLRAEIRRTDMPYYSFTAFRQHPLIRLARWQIVPASIQFLHESMTAGIYWRIMDLLDLSQGNRFATYYGDLFEQYVQNTFRRMFPPSNILATRVEYDLRYGRPERRSSDVIVAYHDSLLLFEAKSSRLKLDTAITGAISRFDADLDESVFKAAQQLDRVIRDFQAGHLQLDNTSPDSIRRIIPVVVTLNPLPVNLFTRKRIDGHLTRAGWLQSEGVTPLVVLSAEELEMLEVTAARGKTLDEMLSAYLAHPQGPIRSMKTFLFQDNAELVPFRNQFLISRFEEIMAHVRGRLAEGQ